MTTLYLSGIILMVGVLVGSVTPSPAVAQTSAAVTEEAIGTFHSDIVIQENGSLEITETIEYSTSYERHGIYRQIPYRYNRDGWRFTTQVDNVRITADGKSVPVEQSADQAFLTLKIGDPDRTFKGTKKYELRYRVSHAVQSAPQDAQLPELYWDITGESWMIPILKTSATITSPQRFEQATCYSGEYGENDNRCSITLSQPNTATLIYPHTVDYGDNVTVRLGIDPSGPLHAPTQQQKTLWWLSDHWPLSLLFLAPLGMIWMYIKRGRDWWYRGNIHTPEISETVQQRWPWNQPAIPFVYEPPQDLSPGEASILIHERNLPSALVAEILELTHRKFLTVERREKKKYWFIKQSPPVKAPVLSPAQQLLLDGLFSGRNEVSLDSLKGTFHTTAQKVQAQLEKQLVERNLISGQPGLIRGIWMAIGLTASGLLAGLVLMILSPFIPLLFWGIEIVAVGVCLACAWAMPRRTADGSNAAWKMKGLQRTIARGAWREKIKEKHLFIEEVLPFAVAFGVVKQLTRDLKDLNLEPPEYANAFIHNGVLSNSLVNSFSSSASSSFAPPSSSSSGWSGGGSSGGGGGGGGGGSW